MPRLRPALLAAVSLMLAAVLAPGASRAADPAAPTLTYRGVTVSTSDDSSDACLRFSDALKPDAEAHYGDYLQLDPAAKPAVRVDGQQLCLSGLAYGTNYQVTLRHGLPAANGSTITADTSLQIAVMDRAPLIAIGGDGWILPRATATGLTIQTVNVPRVRIHVLRMSERLLDTRLQGDSAVNLSQQQIEAWTLRDYVARDATVVWSGTLDTVGDRNRTAETAFPLASVIAADQAGAYLVVAEDPAHPLPAKVFRPSADGDNGWASDLSRQVAVHWVIVSDIGLTTLRGRDGLHVLARSLATAQPDSGVRVRLLSSGQDVLAEAATDASGQVVFAAGLLRGVGAAAPALVTASAADGGFALMDLSRAAFDLSDRGVSGRPAPGPADAYLYTDRGIYRPGETVQLMALLRGSDGVGLDNTPLTLVLRRPDGVEARRVTMSSADQAGFYQALTLSATAARGIWSVEALVDPAAPAAGRVQFDVEDFVPQQLKVTLTPSAGVLQAGDPIKATLDGRFLYGAPAAGLNGEATVRVVRDTNPVADAQGYQFGLVDETIPGSETKLEMPDADAAGHVQIDAPFKAPDGIVSPLKAILTAGLFEPSGRIVQDTTELKLSMKPVLIGIRQRQTGSDWGGVPAGFDLRVFDPAGHAIARSGLHWTLVREERHYDWFSESGGWRFHYHVTDETVDTGSIDIPADRPASFSRQVDWGDYRLVLVDPATQAATSVRFTSGWAPAGDSPDTPDKLQLTADTATVPVGGAVHLHVKGPFAGKALVTVANERVIETRQLDIPADGADFALTASSGWSTGAYVLVSMYRPLQAPARPHDPVRAMGVAWIATDPSPHTLGVAMTLPDKVTPRQTIRVPIHLTGVHPGQTAYVTLAAIDEGILQLTRFKSPDPNTWLLGKRRLGIELRDDYGRLLDGSARAGTIREGGDAGAGGPSLPVTSARIVSLFHAPMQVDADGSVVVPIEVPDFNGELRMMAVAYDHDAVGHADAPLTVRDPVVADVSLPRFLAPGDTARLAVTIRDLDAPAGDYHIALSTDGPVSLQAARPLDYHMAPNVRHGDIVTLTGLDQGVATIRADLTGPNGMDIRHEWQIAVRAPHYPITVSRTETQAPDSDFKIDPALMAQFVPGSVTLSLGYSGFGGIDVPGLLQSLYTYPYGCTEQLASSAFPLVYFDDPSLLGRVPLDKGVHARVQQAIDTILDRQDPSGRFGLWRVSDGEASAWLNVYALDFLLHAKDAGFQVPDLAIKAAQQWLVPIVRGDTPDSWGDSYEQEASATASYAAYVLARSSRVDLGPLRRMHDALAWSPGVSGVLPASVRWGQDKAVAMPLSLGQMAGALWLMGDHGRATDAFNLAVANVGMHPADSWWFDLLYYSPERDLAGLTAIAAEVGDTQLANTLLQRLQRMNLNPDDLNTQDKAWLLVAAHALNHDAAPRSFAVNGAAPATMKLPASFAPDVTAVRNGYTVHTDHGSVLWRTLTVTGAPQLPLPPIAHGYTLKRSVLGLDGKPLNVAHLQQNDRFIVSLEGDSADDASHRTVLVAMLPAGWEIETPITDSDTYDFLGPLSPLRMREARDDRFVAAFDLGSTLDDRYTDEDDSKPHLHSDQFHVAFLVRVVTPGRFTLPEAVVEDMYSPQLMARTAAGVTEAAAR